MESVIPFLLVAATCVISSGELGNIVKRNVGTDYTDADIRRYDDNDCKKKKCKNTAECGDHECCLRTIYRSSGEYRNESYCIPQPGYDRRCDPNLIFTCLCRDGLQCSLRGEKHTTLHRQHHMESRDSGHRYSHVGRIDEDKGVDEPVCGPVHRNWPERWQFKCTKPEDTSLLSDQGDSRGSGDGIIVIYNKVTVAPDVDRLLSAADIEERKGIGNCTWRIGQVSDCSSSCKGTATQQVYCVCHLQTGGAARATEDNCHRDDYAVKPLSHLSCGIKCPKNSPINLSTESSGAEDTTYPSRNKTSERCGLTKVQSLYYTNDESHD